MMQGLEELLDVDPASTIEYHETLNPSIWIDEHLRGEVKIRLLEIAQAFIDFIKIPDINIVDMVIVGSIANFNYSPYSDIDLHIKVDFQKLPFPPDFARDYFDMKKSTWSTNHNITVKEYPVELYIEPSTHAATSGGIYSLVSGQWIAHPVFVKFSINDNEVSSKVNDIIKQSIFLIDNGTSSDMEQILNKIYDMRQAGLSYAGEFSVENIAFKEIRNIGLLQDLKTCLNQKKAKELSL